MHVHEQIHTVVGRRRYKAHDARWAGREGGRGPPWGRCVEGVAVARKGGSERAKVASASRRPVRVSHQPTSTRRVTSLVDPETSRCFSRAEPETGAVAAPETCHRAVSTGNRGSNLESRVFAETGCESGVLAEKRRALCLSRLGRVARCALATEPSVIVAFNR